VLPQRGGGGAGGWGGSVCEPQPGPWCETARFQGLVECNDPSIATRLGVGQRARVGLTLLEHLQAQPSAERAGRDDLWIRKLGRELAADEAIDSKEFFESLEFFLRVRKRVRRPIMVDLACGHGLAGLLFACLEPQVEKVVLLDARPPKSYKQIVASLSRSCPWINDKVVYCDEDLFAEDDCGQLAMLPPQLSVSLSSIREAPCQGRRRCADATRAAAPRTARYLTAGT